MNEVLLEWVIVGPLGRDVGSFTQRSRAEEYADALRSISRIPCEVVNRSHFRRWQKTACLPLKSDRPTAE